MKKNILFLFVFVQSIFVQAQMNFANAPVKNPFGLKGAGALVDIDADGDKDCFSLGRYFENVGNATHPIFIERTNAFGLIAGNMPTSFGDLDNDGDLDAIGYENVGTATQAFFVPKSLAFDEEISIGLRYNKMIDATVPDLIQSETLVDIDADGDLDYFGGGLYTDSPKKIYFARNAGTAAQTKFQYENVANPFELSNPRGESTLTFVDFDNDTDLDCIVGYGGNSSAGNGLRFFRNTGTKTNPLFSFIGDNLFGLITPELASFGNIAFTDIDNDGDNDAFIDDQGELKFYRNTTNNTNAGLLPQSITNFNIIPQLIAGKEVYTITGVLGGGSGNGIVFDSSDPTIVKVVGNKLIPVKAGVTTITAYQMGNSSYQAAVVNQSVAVINNPSRVTQQINGFDALPRMDIGSSFSLASVTGGASGKPVTFTSQVPTIAKIVDNKIVAVSRGECTIIASQAGNSDYLPATDVTLSLKVGADILSQEIKGFPISGLIPNMYPGQSFTITGVTGGDSGNPVVFSIAENDKKFVTLVGNTITVIGIKTTPIPIYASQLGNNDYYNAEELYSNFRAIPNPAKTNQSITGFAFPAFIDVDTKLTITGATGGTSGNPVVFTLLETDTNLISILGNTINFKQAGIYQVMATQAGNDTHNSAIPVTRGIRVKLQNKKKYQQITNFKVPSELVVGSTFAIIGTQGGGSPNPIYYYSSDPTVVSVSGNTLTMLKEGTAEITAGQDGDAFYYSAIKKVITVSVTNTALIKQTITGFDAIPDQIVGNTYTITGVSGGASGKPINFTCTGAIIDGNKLTFYKAGTFVVTAFQSGNTTYKSAPVIYQLVTVGKIPQTIQNVPAISPNFVGGEISLASVSGGSSNNPIFMISSNDAIAKIENNKIVGVAEGTAQITLLQLGDDLYAETLPIILNVSVQTSLSISDFEIAEPKIFIYPNPSSEEFTIDLTNSIVDKTVVIFNSLGQTVKTIQLKSKITKVTNLDLKSGLYLVCFKTEKGKVVKRVVIN